MRFLGYAIAIFVTIGLFMYVRSDVLGAGTGGGKAGAAIQGAPVGLGHPARPGHAYQLSVQVPNQCQDCDPVTTGITVRPDPSMVHYFNRRHAFGHYRQLPVSWVKVTTGPVQVPYGHSVRFYMTLTVPKGTRPGRYMADVDAGAATPKPGFLAQLLGAHGGGVHVGAKLAAGAGTLLLHPGDLMARKEKPDYAGLRSYTRSRQTGLYVGVYDGIEAGMDTTTGRWQTVCETHGWVCSHGTLKTAMDFAAVPLEWCERCNGMDTSE